MLKEDIKMINNIPMKKIIFGEKKKKKNMKRKLIVGHVKENSIMIIKIKRLGIIVILLVGIGELLITYVILSIENLILHL